MALLLQPIMTSPRAFTGQSELGFGALGGESALNSALVKEALSTWGNLIWTPAGRRNLSEINCKVVSLSVQG